MTENGSHTPGPWLIGRDANGNAATVSTGVPSRPIASFYFGYSRLEENARLIAAAPDLYEAAKRVLDHLNARIDAAPATAKPVFDGIAELHTAIAKAEGRTDGEDGKR